MTALGLKAKCCDTLVNFQHYEINSILPPGSEHCLLVYAELQSFTCCLMFATLPFYWLRLTCGGSGFISFSLAGFAVLQSLPYGPQSRWHDRW